MRVLISMSVLFLVACASEAPVTGPQGLTGDTGAVGPVGPQGPAGFSALSVATVSPGVSCDAGGVAILDNDGGQFFVCNGQNGETGAKGDVGATGPQGPQGDVGPQGIQGVQGLSARGPTLYANGQMIGKFTYDSSGFNRVFREDYDCESIVDFKRGTIRPATDDMYFTDVGCSGTPIAAFGSRNFTECTGTGNYVYKVSQPMMMVDTQALSRRYYSVNNMDGGVTETCTTFTTPYDMTDMVIWEPVQYTNITGPFTIGHN